MPDPCTSRILKPPPIPLRWRCSREQFFSHEPIEGFVRRLRTSLGWVAAQFWATLLIVLVGVAWTRVPERHVWQVGLTLLLPLLMLAAVLVLEAGTMRSFFHQDERRVRFAWGALTLLVWIAVVGIAWWILDWCDDQNSTVGGISELARFGARAGKGLHLRAHSALAHNSRLDFPLDCGSGEGDSARAGFGAVGMAAAVAKTAAHDVELALVDRRGDCGARGRTAAQLLLQWRTAWNCRAPGVGRDSEAGCSVSAGHGELGSAAGVGGGAAGARCEQRPKTPGDDALVAAPVGSGPLGEDSVKLPLPESGNDAGGNI